LNRFLGRRCSPASVDAKKNGLLPAEVTSRRATDRRIHASFEYRKVIGWNARNHSWRFWQDSHRQINRQV